MNKAEKIRKEIERLKAETFDNKELSLEEIIAVRNCYNNLLFFIDSLEQPIKRTPAEIEAALQEVEEKSKAFTAAHPNGFDIGNMIKILKQENSTAQISCPRCGSIIRYCNPDLIPDSSCNSYNIFMNAGIRNGKLRCPMCGVEFFTSYIDEKGS